MESNRTSSKEQQRGIVQNEEDLGIFGPPVSGSDLNRLNEKIAEELEYDAKRLSIEEARTRPITAAECRQRFMERAIDNVICPDAYQPHYFVREPGL